MFPLLHFQLILQARWKQEEINIGKVGEKNKKKKKEKKRKKFSPPPTLSEPHWNVHRVIHKLHPDGNFESLLRQIPWRRKDGRSQKQLEPSPLCFFFFLPSPSLPIKCRKGRLQTRKCASSRRGGDGTTGGESVGKSLRKCVSLRGGGSRATGGERSLRKGAVSKALHFLVIYKENICFQKLFKIKSIDILISWKILPLCFSSMGSLKWIHPSLKEEGWYKKIEEKMRTWGMSGGREGWVLWARVLFLGERGVSLVMLLLVLLFFVLTCDGLIMESFSSFFFFLPFLKERERPKKKKMGISKYDKFVEMYVSL